MKGTIGKPSNDYLGTVSWFNDSLGYGFLTAPENFGDKAIFVHYSHIRNTSDFKTLSKGQLVWFEVSETVKGLMAINVREKKVIRVHVDASPC